jgi:hypothetical protein
MHCKLIIKDEVNAKFEGLPAEVRRALVKRFSFELPYARHLPAVRLGRWDGRVNFFQLSGSTYINLLPDILPYLEDQGYDVELLDARDYQTHFTFDTITEQSYSHKTWPDKHQLAGQNIELRPHQVTAINNFLSNPQSLQSIATGSGKTLITSILSQQCEQYGRTLVIVPNKSLVLQTEADYINLGLDVGVYYGDRKELGRTHTISTWQSMNSLLKKTQEGDAEYTFYDFISGVVCVIGDECFDGDARVLTTSGYVPIKSISVGDTVINYSEKDKTFKTDTVVKVHKNLTKSLNERMYELEFDNGSVINVTGNHKFLTNLGWVRADELTEEHDILNKT